MIPRPAWVPPIGGTGAPSAHTGLQRAMTTGAPHGGLRRLVEGAAVTRRAWDDPTTS